MKKVLLAILVMSFGSAALASCADRKSGGIFDSSKFVKSSVAQPKTTKGSH